MLFLFPLRRKFPLYICWRHIEQQDAVQITKLFTEGPDSLLIYADDARQRHFLRIKKWSLVRIPLCLHIYSLSSELTGQASFLFTYLWGEVKCSLCMRSLFLIYTDS